MNAPGRPARRLLGAALMACVVTAGCAQLPDSGPVLVRPDPVTSPAAAPFDFRPPPPVPGARPAEVLSGFLRALQATPAGTLPAADFLTEEAASLWHPEQATVVYDGVRTRVETGAQGSTVTARWNRAFRLDRHGRWAGRVPRGEASEAVFRLRRQDGEWRIASLPDATMVPRSHFETRYRSYALYFFDPTGSVLVPEPVFLPWGPQAPTQLVEGLLAGPLDDERGVVRTYLPRSTELAVSVPVSDSGTAEVPLSSEVRELDGPGTERALAQLVWTLSQVGEVRGVRVAVDGAPIGSAEGDVVVPGDEGRFDPLGGSGSGSLFGIRGGRVLQVEEGDEREVAALREAGVPRARSLGVDAAGQRLALVSEDGSQVRVVALGAEPRFVAGYAGTGLVEPVWDRTGRLWLVDNAAGGPLVRVAAPGDGTDPDTGPRAGQDEDTDSARPIPVPGLTGGREVAAAALSSDGTRLALLTGGGEAQVLVARVVRDGDGAPVRLTQARAVSTPTPLRRPVDLGWRDPTTVAVLTRPTATTTEVVLAAADGASGSLELDATPDTLFERGVALATGVDGGGTVLVLTRTGALHALDVSGRWRFEAEGEPLRALAAGG